jgi:signal transduction histidine kinase
MSTFWSQLSSLLTSQHGNLVYQLVLVFSIAGAMHSAFTHWGTAESREFRRRMLGLGVLLASDVLLFAFSSLDGQGIIPASASLPPLDRAFAVISIIWITWLWSFPEPSRPADTGAGLLSLLTAIAAGLNLVTWASKSSASGYNQTTADVLWQAAAIALVLLGALLLFRRRPNGFGNGLSFLSLVFLGHVAHLLIQEQGNYSGILHLAYLAAYPLLLTLPQPLPARIPALPSKTSESEKPPPGQKRYSAEPGTVRALMELAAESNTPNARQAITRAISLTMVADVCFLVYLTESKDELVVASGYDLIREEALAGGSLNKTAIPMLMNAIQRGRPLRLPASGTAADVKGLAPMLGQSAPSNMLSVPIVTATRESLGGIIVLSPYSKRVWSPEDQAFLAKMAGSLVPIIERDQRFTRLVPEGGKTGPGPEAARESIGDLQRRNDELTRQLEMMTEQARAATSPGEGRSQELVTKSMDLNLIVDNALAYTSSQIREKNISMHLDLPRKVARLSADPEAVEQIMIHLLQNAGAVTPVEGTIGLKVQPITDHGQACVIIQVTDSGGGIPDQDLPRVFTSLYRAGNGLIQGVGDTGVALSVAKSLTEAQDGRIWVESEPGVGATFSVLLPSAGDSPENRPRQKSKT